MPLIGAVADDLTGATTTGVLLARSQARTVVFFNEEAAEKGEGVEALQAVSYTHLRAHETRHDLVCRLLLEKKKRNKRTME